MLVFLYSGHYEEPAAEQKPTVCCNLWACNHFIRHHGIVSSSVIRVVFINQSQDVLCLIGRDEQVYNKKTKEKETRTERLKRSERREKEGEGN